MTEQAYPDAPQMLGFYRRVLAEARGMPGVEDAAIATHLPFTGQSWGNGYEVEGSPRRRVNNTSPACVPSVPATSRCSACPCWPAARSRMPTLPPAVPVAIINSKLAQALLADESPVGKRINVDGPWRTIVGVAADVKPGRLDAPVEPEIYVPYEQLPPDLMKFLGRGVTLLVRSPSLDATLAGQRRARRRPQRR